MRNAITHCTLILFILVSATLQAQVQKASTEESIYMPAFSALKEGWNTLRPGGETRCAFDTPYEFYVRQGDPKKILVYFNGGGACWDYRTCLQPEKFYNAKIYTELHPEKTVGILDLKKPENPFLTYTMVVLPVCTGDTYFGAKDKEYFSEEGESLKVMHRGSINTHAVISWMKANNFNPTKIFVAGSSAGAVATPFYSSVLADQYPKANVVGLMDDASSLVSGKLPLANADSWGVSNMMKYYRKWANVDPVVRVDVLTKVAANNTKNLRLFILDHASDRTQNYYHIEAGSPDIPMRTLMDEGREKIKSNSPGIKGFLLGGNQHVTLVSHKFYSIKSNNTFLKDWVRDIAEGKKVADIDCVNCDYPEFSYQAADLEILKRTKLKLTDKSNWGLDEGGRCPKESNTFSLRCALIKSISEVSGEPPGSHMVLWEFIYRSSIKLNAPMDEKNPMISFNNDPNFGYDGIMTLISEIENTITKAQANKN